MPDDRGGAVFEFPEAGSVPGPDPVAVPSLESVVEPVIAAGPAVAAGPGRSRSPVGRGCGGACCREILARNGSGSHDV